MVNKAQVAVAKTVLVAGQWVLAHKTVVAAPVQLVLLHKLARDKREARRPSPNRALHAVGPGLVPVEVDGLRPAHIALQRGHDAGHGHRRGRRHAHAPGVPVAHGANAQFTGILGGTGVARRVHLDKARRTLGLVLNKQTDLRLHGLLAVLLGRCLNCSQHAVLAIAREDHSGHQAEGGSDKSRHAIPRLTCG